MDIDMNGSEGLDRRTFIKSAAVAGALAAGVGLAGCSSNAATGSDTVTETSAQASQTIDCDVVVVGAGAAGLMASYQLTQAGYDVQLLEKGASAAASNFSMCGGPNACETKLQKQEGEWVSLKTMYDYMYDFSRTSVNAKLLRKVLAGTGPSIDAMLDLGVQMTLWGDPYGVGFRGRHFFTDEGLARTDPLTKAIEAAGGTIVYKADANRILMEDGRATGVQADVDGTVTDFRAKAVLICTGGFIGGEEMQMEHFNTKVFPLGNTLSDGTGINMVLAAGGVLDRNFAVLGNECGAVSPATEGWPFTEDWANKNEHYGYWLFGGLYVDATGNRFIDEGKVAALPLAVGGEALVRAGKAFVIMDSAYYEGLQEKGVYEYLGSPAAWTAGEENTFYSPTAENAEAHLQQAIDEGWGCKADTIAEIAERFGLVDLEETVETYNDYCAKGVDEEFEKEAWFLSPVVKAPFYAFEYVPSAWGTNGGIKIDSCLHAVDTDNDAIPGLFVAGVDTGSMYTIPYYTNPGASVGNAIGSGYAAAQEIAKEIG